MFKYGGGPSGSRHFVLCSSVILAVVLQQFTMAVSVSLYEGHLDYKGPKDKHVSLSD